MKLGILTSILDGWTFQEVLEIAADMGFSCIEVACWPQGKAERRYAGVSHLDVERVVCDDDYAESILKGCRDKKIHISALAVYPNTMDPEPAKRSENIAHLKKVIQASSRLRVNLVTTFIGRDQTKTTEENLVLFQELWPEIIRFAEDNDVKIAIENCPMLFGADQWPGGQNLMTSPVLWRKMFQVIPSPNFGLNFDPSHFVWQQMDYIQPLYEFKDRLFHVHCKDIKLYPEKLAQCGVMAYPLEYMSPKIPGLGDVDWSRYLSALYDVGYDGDVCIEVEDRAFEGSRESILDSIRLSKRYLDQFIL